MNIYLQNETNFNNNGLGFLTDVMSANVFEELNGDYYLSLVYKLDGNLSEYLIEENIIKCKVADGSKQLFRIKRVVKSFTTIEVYATHIFYDLLNNFLLDTSPTELDCQSFGNWILARTNFANNFTYFSDISGTKSARYVRRNPVEAIMGDIDNSMINIFGGDLERDNFTIKQLAQRGSSNGIKLLFGKNIKEIKITTDYSSIITRMLPLGFDGLMIPETYVDSTHINDYITPKVAKVEFSDIKYDPESTEEDAYTDINDAYTALRNACNDLYNVGVDMPQINIKIDWVELSKTKEYENYQAIETLHLGDYVTAEILGLNYQTRVTRINYNPLTDMIDTFEIGTIQKTIANSINVNSQKVEQINVSSILQSARDNATNQINSAMGGYILKTQTDLYIMDTPDPSTSQKIWRWNVNGLGYSDTGIDGPYETAMTADGQIVADMITTGTMSVERIQGLESIILEIQDKTQKLDEEGNATSFKTTYYTFDSNGLLINDGSGYKSLSDTTGQYYYDNDTMIAKYTKDGSVQKDLAIYGKYYYGIDENDPSFDVNTFTKDNAMFMAQMYTYDDGNGNAEEGFGHFYNGS